MGFQRSGFQDKSDTPAGGFQAVTLDDSRTEEVLADFPLPVGVLTHHPPAVVFAVDADVDAGQLKPPVFFVTLVAPGAGPPRVTLAHRSPQTLTLVVR